MPTRQLIEQALEGIARAIEAEDIDRLVAAWPSLGTADIERFRRTFEVMRDIDVSFDIRSLEIDANQATATLRTTYDFYNESTRARDRESFAQTLVFSHRDGRWLVTASR
ncbi:MAG: hypothetical protein ACRELD_12085 [Longimicrobiales bacterium]